MGFIQMVVKQFPIIYYHNNCQSIIIFSKYPLFNNKNQNLFHQIIINTILQNTY